MKDVRSTLYQKNKARQIKNWFDTITYILCWILLILVWAIYAFAWIMYISAIVAIYMFKFMMWFIAFPFLLFCTDTYKKKSRRRSRKKSSFW